MASDLTGKAPTPPAPAQSDPLARAAVAFVRERFADAIVEVDEQHGETTIVLRPEALVAVSTALRDGPALRYTMLVDLTAVDWLERDPRYDVVYHLLSMDTHGVVRVKVRLGDEDNFSPEAPSVTSV